MWLLGVCHADELKYLFKSSFESYPKSGSGTYKVMEHMVDMWVNFAETG